MDGEGVLILTEAFRPNVGGVETFLDHLVSYLRRQGYRLYIFTYQPLTSRARGPALERRDGLEVHRVSWFGHGWRPRLEAMPPLLFLYLFPRLFLASLAFMLRNQRQVKVIHAQSLITAIMALFLARLFGKRAVSTPHTIFRLEDRRLLAWILRPFLSGLDAHLVIAPGAREELVSIGIPSHKVKAFTHWVDLEQFQPLDKAQCQQGLGLAKGFLFLFLGRFHPQKNVHLLLETAELLREEEITFVFVGDGTLEGDIRRAAQQNPRIVLLGPRKNEELAPVYSAADLYWGDLDVDYLSRVTIEAFACGTPALAPNRISILGVTREVKPEAFAEAVAMGILRLVEPEPQALAQELRNYARERHGLAPLWALCRQYAEEYHSERNAQPIELAYRGE